MARCGRTKKNGTMTVPSPEGEGQGGRWLIPIRAGLLLFWLVISTQASAAEMSAYLLRWSTNSSPPIVEVTGFDGGTLGQLQTNQTADWQKLLSVYASQGGDVLVNLSVPAMLGTYQVAENVIRFQPQFPLERGVAYRAVFRPSKLPGGTAEGSPDLVSRYQLTVVPNEPTTSVAQVYPSADVLPENLLKFYLHFSAPMRRGHVYEHIHLRNETGKLVELPFLELDEELWNPEMTRLTLFIDPGRIKRGVKPLEEIGPALEEGKHYTLEIDATWQDSTGLPLREPFRKSFRVGAQDREPPALATWKVTPPKAGTRDPLTVIFPEPMDQALALHFICVTDANGRLAKGTSAVSEHERHWAFSPQEPWSAGVHQLEVQNTIEDLAGNNIGKPFEVDLFERVERSLTTQVAKLPFDVR